MDRTEYKARWYQENKERVQKVHQTYFQRTKDSTRAARNHTAWVYQQRPERKFCTHRYNAAKRGIPWELTFEEWWKIWQDSGKWDLRGSGQYMMCRTNDEGPYKVGNVRIDDATGNIRERFRK